jgi:acyl carrier protein
VLPLTPNGKIDRKVLAAAAVRAQAGSATVTSARLPSTPTASAVAGPAPTLPQAEQLVLEAWRRALGVEAIGLQDNFFDIGGHSLLVIQVLKELREKVARPIQMTDLFRHTTVESLARFLGDESRTEPATERGRDRANARRLTRSRGPVP